jgi:hypothetical protein
MPKMRGTNYPKNLRRLHLYEIILSEPISKMHLTPKGFVAIRFKMLTYYVYAPLLNRIDASPLNVIYNFLDGLQSP